MFICPVSVYRQAVAAGRLGDCPYFRHSLFVLSIGEAAQRAKGRSLVFMDDSWSRCPANLWVPAMLQGVCGGVPLPAVPELPWEELDRENGITEPLNLSANIERAFPASFQGLAAKSWKLLRDEFKLPAMELSLRFLEFFQLQRNGHAQESRSPKHLARE